MNLKKMLISIITTIILIIIVALQGAVYAVKEDQTVYMGIMKLMTNNPDKSIGFSIANPEGSSDVAARIWNIVKYGSKPDNPYTEGNIYCVKSGVGFTAITANEQFVPRPYNIAFDMKTERQEILKRLPNNEILKGLVNGTIPVEGGTINRYDAILALMDIMYLPEEYTNSESDQAQKEKAKKDLIEAVSEYGDSNSDKYAGTSAFDNIHLRQCSLDDEVIIAVQQAALWYFTNSDEAKYDKTHVGADGWFYYTKDGNVYNAFTTPADESLLVKILYDYLIEQAKVKANQYTNSSSSAEAPAKVDTTTLAYKESGNNYIIGPIHITESSANVAPYTIDFKVKNNGTEFSNYKLVDSHEKEVENLVGNDFYISVPKNQVTSLTVNIDINYNDTTMKLWASTTNNGEQPLVELKKEPKNIPVELKFEPKKPEKIFDLALRKYITKVVSADGTKVTNIEGSTSKRNPEIDTGTLATGTTAIYKHKKDPVTIATGDKVTYKMTIYNEGEKEGRATKVVDQLPTGLKFSKIVSGNFDLASYNEDTNTLNLVRKSGNLENLEPYKTGDETRSTLDSETIEIECIVTAVPDTAKNKILTNVAWISEEIDAEENITIINQKDADRDSEPATKPDVNKDNMESYVGRDNKTDLSDPNYYYKGQQDDDDFEKLILLPQAFDLKLIKCITEVNGQEVPKRIEKIDVSKLNTLDEDGKMVTTADYKLNKEPVGVKKGDIVTYAFHIFNEGTMDGYAQEITEDVPEGLEFLWSEKEGEELKADKTLTDEEKEAIEFNQKYLWGKFQYDDTGKRIEKISSDYLSRENESTVEGNLIKAFGENDGTKTEEDLDSKELFVKFKVVSENIAGTVIRNEAAITDDSDKNGDPVDDRDSTPEEWKKYEDDEDYDRIILQSFDLALRKFIIAVSNDTKIDNNDYLKKEDGSYQRAPVVDTSKLNKLDENGKLITTATYNHTKEPVLVKPNDIVVYMLRVYNEGDMDGYAAEIKDHLPPYLEFVEDEFNQKYGWKVSEDGRTVTTNYLENSLINKAKEENGKIVLTYKEVPIMCKVNEKAKSSENITNIADITKYLDENKKPVTDRDSQENNVKLPEDKDLPGYKDNETGDYIPGQQDDDDFEKLIVKIFDLALRKWVTQAVVIENGKETITQTGHDAWDDPEAVVKVELHRKKLDQVTVKFRYSIRVYNQGDIEGYAKEITDYVPKGLKFVAKDNPGWNDEGNNVISTRLLENTLLKPGEYADVEVLLTWENSENNMGVMNNTAEISEDYNEYGVPDIDSTPDNKKKGEDDIDDAPVMLSISTGQIRIYFTLGFIVLITVAGGVILIKKFVL